MGFINIYVASNAYINIKNKQLELTNKINSNTITYPLEDVNSVLIDNLQTTISSKTLIELSKNNIIAYICDENHIPQSYLLAYNSFYKNLNIYSYQVNVKKPIIKNIWKNIVSQKIKNQSEVLEILNIKNDLKNYLLQIKSDDTTNVEAIVANKYFKLLFGDNFNRRDENNINSALNYGYAIVRGAIARSVVAHGLQPYLGVHHCNQLNNFNLVDDLIECFRPVVDLFVKENLFIFSNELNHQSKMMLVNILNFDVKYKNQLLAVSYAIDNLVENYIDCLKNQNFNIVLPSIIEIKMHEYE